MRLTKQRLFQQLKGEAESELVVSGKRNETLANTVSFNLAPTSTEARSHGCALRCAHSKSEALLRRLVHEIGVSLGSPQGTLAVSVAPQRSRDLSDLKGQEIEGLDSDWALSSISK